MSETTWQPLRRPALKQSKRSAVRNTEQQYRHNQPSAYGNPFMAVAKKVKAVFKIRGKEEEVKKKKRALTSNA